MFWKCIFSPSAINPPFYALSHFSKSRLLQRFSALLAQFDTFRLHSFLDIPQVGKDVFKSAHH